LDDKTIRRQGDKETRRQGDKETRRQGDKMIRMLRHIWLFISLAIFIEIMLTGCSERASEPVILPDSTIAFPPKKVDGISAKITFSRHLAQKSIRQSAISTVFPLKEDGNVYAVIELENRLNEKDLDLMFHVDWIDPEGRSFYLKRIDLYAGDSTASLVSSVSVPPDRRLPGKYLLRIYLFRELIAEKYFELRDESQVEKVSANIVFFKSIDKESGEMKGIDTVFEIKKKGILRAQIDLENLHIFQDEELPVRLEWIGPDGESFYSKKINVKPADSLLSITGSISITPEKRQSGEYFLRIYLFEELVRENRFVLKPSD
jgi:hypothetical protein